MTRTLAEAIEQSKLGIAYRVKDDGLLMFWAPAAGEEAKAGYWTQQANGLVRRFVFPRKEPNYTDWKPLLEGSNEHTIFVEKNGEPPGEGSAGWTKAIGASPVNTAMRRDKDGVMMFRRSKDRTWRYVPHTGTIIRLRQGFRHYSGWEPMPADHPLADAPWGEERIPYREAADAPGFIPKAEVDEWVRTGTCPSLKAHQEQSEQERKEHNRSIDRRKRIRNDATTIPLTEQLKDRAELIRVAKTTPPCQEVGDEFVIDEPAPEVLANIGVIMESLAVGIKAMVEIGENTMATELAERMKHMVGNASWLLRSDRTEWARKKAGDGG